MIKTLFLAISMACGAATAATAATLVATPTGPEYGGFTIDFTDANNDSLLEYSEIDSFSGFMALTVTMTSVNTVPDIAGISKFSFPADFGQPSDSWRFLNDNPGLSTFQRDLFTYDLTLDNVPPSQVPLPAGLPLLAAALGLIAIVRRSTR